MTFAPERGVRLGPAEIGDRRGIAHPLVGRRQPRLARAVELDHAEQPFAARGQLLHRMRGPTRPGLLGARQHPVAGLERRMPLALHQPQPWRRGAIVGAPRVGNRDRLALLDVDHAQHGNLGHAAHAVEGGLLAVDQPFVRHVAQQALERDLLLAFQAKGLGDLALAGWLVGGLDELDDLLLRRQAGHLGVARHRAAMAGCRHTRKERAGRPVSASRPLVDLGRQLGRGSLAR